MIEKVEPVRDFVHDITPSGASGVEIKRSLAWLSYSSSLELVSENSICCVLYSECNLSMSGATKNVAPFIN